MSKHFSYNKKNHTGPMEADRTDSVPNGDPAGTETPAQDASQNPVGDAGSGDPAGAAAAGGTGPAGAGAESGPEDRVADLEAQLAEAKDQFLRKVADFENFRKRMIREKQDAIDFANQSLLTDLIPILDDFDRALQSAQNSRDFAALYEGVGMIAKRLSSTLESKWGLKSYLAAGALFDPNFHEALMMEKSSAVDEQTVQFDLLKGYTLKDRVIRSAKVKVLIPDPSAPAIAAPVSPDAGGTGDNAAGGAHGNAAGAGTGEVKAGEAQS